MGWEHHEGLHGSGMEVVRGWEARQEEWQKEEVWGENQGRWLVELLCHGVEDGMRERGPEKAAVVARAVVLESVLE